ncbi:Protein of unknown function [Gryllus bimaculatus]|nr:Protein of unknown function [Gryllus bimaculatus]
MAEIVKAVVPIGGSSPASAIVVCFVIVCVVCEQNLRHERLSGELVGVLGDEHALRVPLGLQPLPELHHLVGAALLLVGAFAAAVGERERRCSFRCRPTRLMVFPNQVSPINRPSA